MLLSFVEVDVEDILLQATRIFASFLNNCYSNNNYNKHICISAMGIDFKGAQRKL